MVAGGVESMSMVPMLIGVEDADPWLREHRPRYTPSWGLQRKTWPSAGTSAGRTWTPWPPKVTAGAAQAQVQGCFDGQIIPVQIPGADGQAVTVIRDEGIRPGTTAEKLAELKPCFLEDGLVTAATSSQRTDGAGFVVLMSAERAQAMGLKPLARFVTFATGGVPAEVMGVGPIEAVPKALKKAGLTLEEMDTIELNEAFASQALACIRTLGMDPARVNPVGGRHGPGASAGRYRRHSHMQGAELSGTYRRPVRYGDDVHRRRHGGRGNYRAPVRRRSHRPKVRRIVDDGPPHLFFKKAMPPRLCLAGRILRLFPCRSAPAGAALYSFSAGYCPCWQGNASPFQAPLFVLY